MGHTAWSGRIATDELIRELKLYGKSLRESDRFIYEDVMRKAFKHIGSISYTSSMHLWAFFLLSIIFEQEKKIKKLENESMANGYIQDQESFGNLAQDS